MVGEGGNKKARRLGLKTKRMITIRGGGEKCTNEGRNEKKLQS